MLSGVKHMKDSKRVVDQSGTETHAGDHILFCKNILKRFGSNVALDNVDLQILRGEIHALVGQNGAGKSTLVKIITGVYAHDEGTITVDSKEVKLNNPLDAEREGIAIIHQDQQLVHQFDVKRNMFLGREIKKMGCFLDFNAMRAASQEVLDHIDAGLEPDVLVQDLSVGQRAQVAIASALLKHPKILILDEPTASLSRKEVQKLYDIIRRLKQQGVTIIYISHHFDEIFEISDRITVLRDGKKITTLTVDECNKNDVIQAMIGRNILQLYPKKALPLGEDLLELKSLSFNERVSDVSFTLRKGEILGIAGILGSGTAELAMTLFGVNKKTSGQVLIHQKEAQINSPRAAKKAGIAFIPEDRRTEGLVGNMSVKENLSLAATSCSAKNGFINNLAEKTKADEIIQLLHIKTDGINQFITTLSGGNQQKVIIGRWLPTNSEIYILNQPTTGVDVGSKVEIYNVMTDLASKGAGIIMISQDFEELLGMCDRVLVISKGKIVKAFRYGEASESELLQYATSNL